MAQEYKDGGRDRRKMLKLVPSVILASSLFVTMDSIEREDRKTSHRPALDPGPEVRAPKFNDKSFVEFFRKNYGDKARRLASIVMSAYKGCGSGCPYDPLLFMAQIKNESYFGYPGMLISRVGAAGSVQVMPETAENEPFGLNVYNPSYYSGAKALYNGKPDTLKPAIEGLIHELANKDELKSAGITKPEKIYSGEEATRILDIAIYVIEHASEEFGNSAGSAGTELDYLFSGSRLRKLLEEGVLENLKKAYALYEDDLGSMVYEGYNDGDVRSMRKGLMKPLPLLPEKELDRIDQRFVDEVIVPKSYREMQRLTAKYGTRVALAAYNAGEGAITEAAVPNIRETRNYVDSVLKDYNLFSSMLS